MTVAQNLYCFNFLLSNFFCPYFHLHLLILHIFLVFGPCSQEYYLILSVQIFTGLLADLSSVAVTIQAPEDISL